MCEILQIPLHFLLGIDIHLRFDVDNVAWACLQISKVFRGTPANTMCICAILHIRMGRYAKNPPQKVAPVVPYTFLPLEYLVCRFASHDKIEGLIF